MITSLFLVTALGAKLMTPVAAPLETEPQLNTTVPTAFGDWRMVQTAYAQVQLSTDEDPTIDHPYDQTVMRTYVNARGEIVNLALAWGRSQKQEVKVHRPDLCYIAQGYKVVSLSPLTFSDIPDSGGRIVGKRMVAMGSRGGEAVSYWIRIGKVYSENAFETRAHILKEGLGGHVPDGILVRVSSPIGEASDAAKKFPVIESFLHDLVAASPASSRSLLVR